MMTEEEKAERVLAVTNRLRGIKPNNGEHDDMLEASMYAQIMNLYAANPRSNLKLTGFDGV